MLTLLSYIFMGIGLFSIAEIRKIDHPWLAWLPIGNLWLLGCISDHYRYVTRGEMKKRRTALLILPIIVAVLVCATLYLGLGTMVISLIGENSWDTVTWILCAVLALVRLIQFVIEQMAIYDLHRSCNPDNAVLFLIVGMLVPVTRSLFILLNRDKEQGMPPRKVKTL